MGEELLLRDHVAVARRYESGEPLPRPPFCSLGHGAAGIAYFLLRYAAVTGDPRWLDSAGEWVAIAEAGIGRSGAFVADGPVFPDERAAIPASLCFGETGVWWCGALVAGRSVERFVNVAEACPPERVDIVSGSAGLLVGAAALVEQLGPSSPGPLLTTGDRLAARLNRVAGVGATVAPGELGWLGAAHGWGGIAFALLRWSQATGTAPGPELGELLNVLRDARLPSGLWPRHTSSEEVWPGWCHGSAGWVHVWTLAGDLDLAEAAGAHAVGADGAGPGLCCGRAGIAYAALVLYQSTADETWLAHARRLAGEASGAGADAGPDFPEHSLWQGDVGVALLSAELEDPSSAAMPLYRRSLPTMAR